MSSKEAILSRLRGAPPPLPTHHTPGSPGAGRMNRRGASAFWHDHRQPRRDPHRQGGKPCPGSERLAGRRRRDASGLWPGRPLAGGGRGACAGRSVLTPAGSSPAGRTICSTPVRRASPTARGHRRYRHARVAARWWRAAHLIPVPPCHIALLAASTIADNLAGLVAAGRWQQAMPTNLLLVSGPPRPPTSSRPWPTAPTARVASWWCWWRIADGLE